MAVTHMVRGFVLVGVVGWYTTGVWRGMNRYFDGEFKKYLDKEKELNPKMKNYLEYGTENPVPQPPHQLQTRDDQFRDIETEIRLKALEDLKTYTATPAAAAHHKVEYKSHWQDEEEDVCPAVPPADGQLTDGQEPCG